MLTTLSLETILGDDCICEGRCKECVITSSHKLCKLCSGFFGIDFKNLGIDGLDSNELQIPRRTCVCPADYRELTSDNYSSSEIIFVKLECGVNVVDHQLCIGINPQIFLIGSNFAEYWIIIGSILSIVFILCCALYSLFKNNWCFASENLISIYGQNFPLSTINQSRLSRVNSINSLNRNENNQNSTELMSDSSHPPTYDEIFVDICLTNISSNSNQNYNSSDKRLFGETKSESNDVLPSYEEATKNPVPKPENSSK